MIMIKEMINNRQAEYDEYLNAHISNTIRAWNDILMPYLESLGLHPDTLSRITSKILKHDESKYTEAEYDAYLEYFYPSDGSVRDFDNVPADVDERFDLAWLHHQKVNQHHWQYWIITKDSGNQYPLDMSLEAICEMLCDWHSFSAKNPESTAYQWYEDNKENMVLSDKTRELVEEYIVCMTEPLSGVV